ncbi:GCN5 family acetyltransferase [Methyloprofundus sedimenti]|uniref:GCN5 family acetyltransferase n=1 Tax=Methyloprofundus sedimenti TaxID=1420851 RepID=A0A1V8MAI0_9GAMM|nr:GNAT family N-acetyltransferase [Methyloprofundus sedimenti]OQK18604.1 GCN5 family acetyltransferase [Methyloprofundus sedimenti]
MNAVISHAEKMDIDAMCELLRALFEIESDFTFNAEKHRNGLELMLEEKQTCCIFVAEIDQLVIGMCSIQVLFSTAEGGQVGLIEDLIVHERYRRHGIGRQLLLAIENWAQNQGLSRIQLLADKGNKAALDFYLQQAWHNTDLVALRKSLL